MRDDLMPQGEMEIWSQAIARPLRAPEALPDDFDARLMAAVRRESHLLPPTAERSVPPARALRADARPHDAPRTWRTARPLRTSPLRGLLAAAGLAAIVFLGASTLRRARAGLARTASRVPVVAAAHAVRHDTVYVTRFVFVAPQASTVALVGDFNSWDSTATKLRPTHGGAWAVSVSLPRGRHEYAFVVDGRRWLVDPSAPLTRDDEFGVRSSVITVGST